MRTARNPRSGFGRTHLVCPCPLAEKGAFSEFVGKPGCGYCHACLLVVHFNTPYGQRSTYIATAVAPVPRLYIDHAEVTSSIASITSWVAEFKMHLDYASVVAKYVALRQRGYAHQGAFVLSGRLDFAIERITALSASLSKLPSFIREFIQLTRSPEILEFYTIGTSTSNEVLFWIVGPDGRVRNAQAVRYRGLERIKEAHARYVRKTADGFSVGEFFGAELLQASYLTWTGMPRTMNADVFLVESAKSAMLASVMYPDQVWLASLGTSGVNATKARSLRGRTVKILFDNDKAGSEGAAKALAVLRQNGAHAIVLRPETVFGGQRPEGWDIGDEVQQTLRGLYGI